MNEFHDESWSVDSDQKAEWAMEKIAEARAELAKWEAFYDAKKESARKEIQGSIDFFMGQLQRYFSTQEHRVTKSGIRKYALPSGELILKPGGIEYQRDDALILQWCEQNLPAAVKETITRKAAWAEVKAYIKETGDIPDGVELVMTEPIFQIKEATK